MTAAPCAQKAVIYSLGAPPLDSSGAVVEGRRREWTTYYQFIQWLALEDLDGSTTQWVGGELHLFPRDAVAGDRVDHTYRWVDDDDAPWRRAARVFAKQYWARQAERKAIADVIGARI